MENSIEKSFFSSIDGSFAKTILSLYKETDHEVFLAYLLATARSGHLCIEFSIDGLMPSPFFLVDTQEEAAPLEETILKSFRKMPVAFAYQIDGRGPFPKVPVYIWENRVYLQRNWELEELFILHLQRVLQAKFFREGSSFSCNPALNEEQSSAVEKALRFPISIISGGPGTGKSFTAIEIVRSFFLSFPEEKRKELRVKLAAPTGKVAALLEKNIALKIGEFSQNIECGTLHSFLKMGGYEESRTIFADLFLIDEASMVDAGLFVEFLSRLQSGGRVIFMGDKDQLPPVEAGSFFADLIEVGHKIRLPCTLLKKSLRIERKELQELADALLSSDIHRVKEQEGIEILSSNRLPEIKERVWLECKEAFSFFVKECTKENLFHILTQVDKFRVLSCMRKGLLGVDHLNSMVLGRFLGSLADEESLICPILITTNDPKRQLMNGDVGILYAKASSLRKAFYESTDIAFFLSKDSGEFREIPAAVLPSFEFAYCLSVHKSQGSEYGSVLVLAPSGSERLGREVLYTAVTRAKKSARLIIGEDTLASVLRRSARKLSGIQRKLSG